VVADVLDGQAHRRGLADGLLRDGEGREDQAVAAAAVGAGHQVEPGDLHAGLPETGVSEDRGPALVGGPGDDVLLEREQPRRRDLGRVDVESPRWEPGRLAREEVRVAPHRGSFGPRVGHPVRLV
jgi:hypothetical protein